MNLKDYINNERKRIKEALTGTFVENVIIDDIGGVQRSKRDIDTNVVVLNWTTNNFKADSTVYAIQVQFTLYIAEANTAFENGKYNDTGIVDKLADLSYNMIIPSNFNESLQALETYQKTGMYIVG